MSTSAGHDEATGRIEALLSWAEPRGIKLNGIAPKPLPGRGIGIIATRDIKVGEEVLHVPAASLRTIANTPERIKGPLKGASVHAILACALHFDLASSSPSSPSPENRDFVPWRDVFPSERDVRSSLPLCWDARLQSLLPHTAAGLLAKQRAKFEADLAAVQAAFPSPSPSLSSGTGPAGAVGIGRQAYLYAWLLVNTRTFYHTTPATERGKTRREDRMALQPVADLLNHSPTRGCGVSYDARGFRITARADHVPGDEVFIQYGPHGNDFLLTEYGFVLGGEAGANPFDEACLDEHVLPRLGAAEARMLRREGFHGGYMLDAETTACYRTQVALRCALLPEPRWRDFLDGLRPEDEDQAEVDALLHGPVLGGLEAGVHEALARVDAMGARTVDEASRALLRERWLQIKQLVVLARHRAASS
ncbi:hypothetical protein N3K66_000828 [Trichothecium roseum]|uniref:Uncharacterized protein n=1 Tax=Trichothecium roseum TaxID=47278 RepID=A0ACC0VD20_9HYPO|nr:hypothetical protein N3K66_000828 [Trichothecium roseum]